MLWATRPEVRVSAQARLSVASVILNVFIKSRHSCHANKPEFLLPLPASLEIRPSKARPVLVAADSLRLGIPEPLRPIQMRGTPVNKQYRKRIRAMGLGPVSLITHKLGQIAAPVERTAGDHQFLRRVRHLGYPPRMRAELRRITSRETGHGIVRILRGHLSWARD